MCFVKYFQFAFHGSRWECIRTQRTSHLIIVDLNGKYFWYMIYPLYKICEVVGNMTLTKMLYWQKSLWFSAFSFIIIRGEVHENISYRDT